MKVILGVGCVAVFAKTLDHRSYQDDGPSPTEQELSFLHRNKTLFSDIMQLIACQGIRDGDEDPYLIFKDALLHFSKALLCYSQHLHQPHSRTSQTVPTDKLKSFICTDIKHFWGDQLEDELYTFYQEELPNQRVDSVLINTFLPNHIIWAARQAEIP